MNAPDSTETFSCARFIKEIGRGPHGARSLSSEDTHALYAAMLDGRVPELELGAVLLAYRLKGETADELAAMLSAAHASFAPIAVPAGDYRAVSIPSYNGARKQPNLVPLLALLLARDGVPVLVHGVQTDPGRVTSAEIFAALNLPNARDHADIEAQLADKRVAFASIETLAPQLARLLSLRRRMGVRNSTHTLVKLLQPFAQPGLRLVNYTHPPYRESLSALFAAHPEAAVGGALLARGTEGEAVADTRRQVQVDWLHDGVCDTLIEPERSSPDAPEVDLPEGRDAPTTAEWIADVLRGEVPVPDAIARQVETIKRIAKR
ncbi:MULTISPECIES: DNA-binding protein YbiB [Paraburkholderia]|uniref:Anthranilate phosphoribosyltransferase n=1 Tax=Paraburkholderia tropica TaxID=92647 RepID=A0AAQ1GBV4_9BURK|nr:MULTISPECIES: DNA-binding protein YbiB [Paraburkholderia]MBB2998023.1 anthranilate phosphoribosyltransferase [Paraburkholderia tropica]MBB6317045.1 anthranilate phosphoribosyltransferase [Paraburkholderia tropica]MDE1142383.1 DNA-binding protein YbiB [Paraburkholderia tropica]PXX20505.1 anthranilate phosphoribosyltransferase [Paraburkholderia tropica]PZW89583.1 anthranilate phosphoribosyltransferase [Paraburkholderia tropica]